jgi:hypothetical protein
MEVSRYAQVTANPPVIGDLRPIVTTVPDGSRPLPKPVGGQIVDVLALRASDLRVFTTSLAAFSAWALFELSRVDGETQVDLPRRAAINSSSQRTIPAVM